MKVSVIGCGYLGAVHAACMADLGHEVVGIDVDADKIAGLAAGEPPFHEPGFDDLLRRALSSGRLVFTTAMAEAARAQVHFICVGTPSRTATTPPICGTWTPPWTPCSPSWLGTTTARRSWSASRRSRWGPRNGLPPGWPTRRPTPVRCWSGTRSSSARASRSTTPSRPTGWCTGCPQALTFLREVEAINLRRREHVVDLAASACGGDLSGVRVAVLTAAFKPDSDDIRDSPALAVAAAVAGRGSHVVVTDPAALENVRRTHPDLTVEPDVLRAVDGADVVLLLTEWRQYIELDPAEVGRRVARRQIIDGRNALDPSRWRAAGWTYRGLGRP